MNKEEKTIQYYRDNAEKYFDDTVSVDMSPILNSFVSHLGEGAKILDLGCGSGRDSKAFLEKSYNVTSLDACEELCKRASEYIGQNVICTTFSDFETDQVYDGIWACASLLHLDAIELLQCLEKMVSILADGGMMYLSFKEGDFSGERDGRFYTDWTVDSIKEVIEKVSGLSLYRVYTTDDYRRDNETNWLNVFLKKEPAGSDMVIELQEPADVEIHRGMTIVPAFSTSKTLSIKKSTPGVDFNNVLAQVVQYADIGAAISHIEKNVEYVVQIPLKYQKQFESGEFFINRNKTTGVEWPTLMRITDKGQYRFVDDLPIKQQEFVQGNPMHELSSGFYNIAMQHQMAAIADAVEQTYKVVERIENGQMDDRIALLNAGREGMILALTMTDEQEKMRAIALARQNLITAKHQIGNALKRRAEEFEAVPGSGIGRLFAEIKHSGFLSERDDEVETIQSYYELYLESTKLLAASYVVTGEIDAAEQAFIGSISFMDGIDFSRVQTIENAHKNANLSAMFYRNAAPYLSAEKVQHLEDTKAYEYISLEVSGQKLLEALNDGRTEEIQKN